LWPEQFPPGAQRAYAMQGLMQDRCSPLAVDYRADQWRGEIKSMRKNSKVNLQYGSVSLWAEQSVII